MKEAGATSPALNLNPVALQVVLVLPISCTTVKSFFVVIRTAPRPPVLFSPVKSDSYQPRKVR